MDPAITAQQVAEAKEALGVSTSSDTVFFAVKNNSSGEPIASISLERTQAAPLNNNIIPLLTPEEKEEVYANVRLVMAGLYKRAGINVDITETTFKTFDRYHTLIVSLRQSERHNPSEAHVVSYFLPDQTHLLTATYSVEAVRELNPDFTIIMDSFDPDKEYQTAPAPAREEGENLADYLSRIYKTD
jgi:hypothetical protein